MKKITLLLLITFYSLSVSFGQNADLDKRMKKVNSFISKDKLEKASDKLSDLLTIYSGYGEGWDLQTKLKYKFWQDAKQVGISFGNISVEVKGADGEEPDEEAVLDALNLAEMLNNFSPAGIAHDTYLRTLRSATMRSYNAYYSCILLRSETEVMPADTNISEKGLAYYAQAEQYFRAKKYEKAAEYYESAVLEDRDFFKAQLYWGDAYYFMGDYLEAIEQFKKAKAKFPEILEPRKYLVDSYARDKQYQKSVDEAIETFAVYPDFSMVQKLKDALELNNQKISIEWTPRAVFPNFISKDTTGSVSENGPWSFYKKAKNEITQHCTKEGLIKENNGLTECQYLEVYSWERMLEQSDDPSLKEAKRMKKLGYLDCYVLVTCFHHDFLDQYKDFAKNNKERIIEYFNEFIE